jgi:zinc transport system ATP-binding protein
MTEFEKAIEIKGLDFSFDTSLVLEDINLDVMPNDFMAVVGPNGSGKTTLLKIVLGLLKPNKGSVQVLGITPSQASPMVGYVPQYTIFDLSFPVKVIDVVLMGRLGSNRMMGRFKREDIESAENAMNRVGIADLKNNHISELSGGQRQRVLVARALAGNIKLLVLDEPTASVDSTNEVDIYKHLSEINKTVTIVLVTHDLGFISNYVNKVACVNRRLVCHKTEDITSEIIDQTYQTNVKMISHKCGL